MFHQVVISELMLLLSVLLTWITLINCIVNANPAGYYYLQLFQ